MRRTRRFAIYFLYHSLTFPCYNIFVAKSSPNFITERTNKNVRNEIHHQPERLFVKER